MAQARILTEAGIRIHSMDEDRGLLVASHQVVRARAALAAERDKTVLALQPLERPVDATIDVPGSKSHTNRALLCAALAAGRSRLARVLVADDTEAMMGALAALGAPARPDPDGAGTVVDIGGGLSPDLVETTATDRLAVDVAQSGTTGRFLLPVLAATPGRFVLDGHAQLRARPFGPQLEALRAQGADIGGDRLPFEIDGRRLDGGTLRVAADLSSQFLSGLLLAAPLAAGETTITVDGPVVSRPYVELTTSTMAHFGVEVDVSAQGDETIYRVPAQPYQAADLALEPDASAASYFFALAAVTGGRVRVEGLGAGTIQGDLEFVELLGAMGAQVEIGPTWTEVRGTGTLRGIEADLSDLSDTAQTLAVVAAFADSPTTITGIGFIRHKETDRIGATVNELRRRGLRATEEPDGMVIHPGVPRPGPVRTYDDHRMAMSFALLGMVHPGIEIENPGCVSKTFPDFFERLDRLHHES